MEVPWWLPTVFTAIGLAMGYYIHSIRSRLRAASAERSARLTLEDAKREADSILREAKIQARDEVVRAREAFENEIRERRKDQAAAEERLAQREENLDRKLTMLEQKDAALDEKLRAVEKQEAALHQREQDLQNLAARAQEQLQQAAAMSRDEARKILMQKLEEELKGEFGALIRRMQEEARATAERQAREIITTAVERYAAAQIHEITANTVTLPNEDMKGRIIGREGRNIRAFEQATGVNLLIDDTPEVVVISSFDPVRREIARRSLERLMTDGRIQPSRIEEVVAQVKEEIEQMSQEAGEAAIYELGLQGIAPELVRTLGRLKFRHSFAQNVLEHSMEMARLMGMMAADLGLDTDIAKRVGLFHDIGKALDHEVEGSHVQIGADLLRRYGESPIVCEAVALHHESDKSKNIYAVLCSATDTLSASRPGARSETTEIYLKRLEKLEEIANNYRGVEKSFAMQAGREIRVFVEPKHIDDNEAMQLARNIAKEIEEELEYPGQIKVTVIRETRCVEYAR
jgi:ribonuclease Y